MENENLPKLAQTHPNTSSPDSLENSSGKSSKKVSQKVLQNVLEKSKWSGQYIGGNLV